MDETKSLVELVPLFANDEVLLVESDIFRRQFHCSPSAEYVVIISQLMDGIQPWLGTQVLGRNTFHYTVLLPFGHIFEFDQQGPRMQTLSQWEGKNARALTSGSCADFRGRCIMCRLKPIGSWHHLQPRVMSRQLFPTLNSVEERVQWILENTTHAEYHLARLNCEHIARYVLTGEPISAQIDNILHSSRGISTIPDSLFDSTNMRAFHFLLFICLIRCAIAVYRR